MYPSKEVDIPLPEIRELYRLFASIVGGCGREKLIAMRRSCELSSGREGLEVKNAVRGGRGSTDHMVADALADTGWVLHVTGNLPTYPASKCASQPQAAASIPLSLFFSLLT